MVGASSQKKGCCHSLLAALLLAPDFLPKRDGSIVVSFLGIKGPAAGCVAVSFADSSTFTEGCFGQHLKCSQDGL